MRDAGVNKRREERKNAFRSFLSHVPGGRTEKPRGAVAWSRGSIGGGRGAWRIGAFSVVSGSLSPHWPFWGGG